MSRIPGVLVGVNEYVKVVLMLVFEAFRALAVNTRVLPNCMEALVTGFRVIVAGKGEVPGGLFPPQAAKNRNEEIVMIAQRLRTKCNLPMHPLVVRR
jgi:hypothetical protein